MNAEETDLCVLVADQRGRDRRCAIAGRLDSDKRVPGVGRHAAEARPRGRDDPTWRAARNSRRVAGRSRRRIATEVGRLAVVRSGTRFVAARAEDERGETEKTV